MLVYRVAPVEHADDLTGEGARLFGGRWNPMGRPAVYTAETASLAMLEIVAYYSISGRPPELALSVIEIPDAVTIEAPSLKDLPPDWKTCPDKASSANFGLRWLNEKKASVLRVPSIITPDGYGWNYVLNPLHPELAGMSIKETVRWDIDSRIASFMHFYIKSAVKPLHLGGDIRHY